MRSVIVIPARYASSRFPGKPLVMIAGQSLIERVYRRAIESREAFAVYVATDDDRIAAHARAFGANVVETGEAASGTDRIAQAIDSIERREGHSFDAVINIQGDEPLIDVSSVDRMIRSLEEPGVAMVTLACPITSAEEFSSPDVVKVVTDRAGDALYFSRAPIPHGGNDKSLRHVGIYGYRTEVLRAFAALPPSALERAERLEQLRALENGFKIRVLETAAPHLGVDRPEDVARIESELRMLASGRSE
jgi:3-deoxy-manno-octulosonate cytidylyltransferase (CMP-KDO synthetase)